MENLEKKPSIRFWLLVSLLVLSTVLLISFTSYVVTIKILDSRSNDALLVPKTCSNGKNWRQEDAVLYYPDFLNYHYKSEDQQLKNMTLYLLFREIFREYTTLIINCPSADHHKYTEHELELVSYLAAYVRESLTLYGSAPSVWLQIGNGNVSACIELAKAANQQEPGIVAGMVITDDLLMELTRPYITSASTLNSESLEEWFDWMVEVWFEIRFTSTYGNWEANGLKAAMIISPLYCFAFEEQFPKNFMKRFERNFFLEETPKRLVVAHGIPFLTLSDSYKSCRNYLEGRFDLKLVLPQGIVPKAAASRPYCLL